MTRRHVNDDPLTGRLVKLRALCEPDLADLCRWWTDPAVAIHQSGRAPSPQPEKDLREMFWNWADNSGNKCGFAITTVSDGTFVGQASLNGAMAKDRCAEFAIIIGPEHQNRGLGTDATRLMVTYGFEELGLHRIELGVFAYNERAIAAYRKAGFVEEGRRRSALYRSGQWHDRILMGILRPEFEAARTSW